MSLSALSDAYRADQDRIDREAARRLAEIFPALSLKDLDRTAPGWAFAVQKSTAQHHAQSQSLAADIYSAVRREAGAISSVSFVLPDLNEGKLRASLTWGGPMFGKRLMSEGGKIPDVARVLFSQTSATSLRFGANGGREMMSATAQADQATTGRYGVIRVPGPRACGFCAMCAMQVYNSMDTADGDFHDHDKCTAMPRIGDAIPEGYADRVQEWEEIYGQSTVTKKNKRGIDVIDAKATIRNMNRIMRERYGA